MLRTHKCHLAPDTNDQKGKERLARGFLRPCQCIRVSASCAFFQVPEGITRLVKAYFQDLQFCDTTQDSTTAWQHLEIGIMAGCTISPLAFTMAMELIIRASRWVVGGERLKSGLRLPPIRAYMDDMTTITMTNACTKCLLYKLQGNIRWARMEIKPSKSRSISIIKGQIVNERFYISDEPIPTILEKPIKSLGRWYNTDLKTLNSWNNLSRIPSVA